MKRRIFVVAEFPLHFDVCILRSKDNAIDFSRLLFMCDVKAKIALPEYSSISRTSPHHFMAALMLMWHVLVHFQLLSVINLISN